MRNFKLLFVIALLFTLAIVGCKKEDNPLIEEEDHYEAEGMRAYNGDSTIVSIFHGLTNDTIKVRLNQSTPFYNVKFYDSQKVQMLPPDDIAKTFVVITDDTTVVKFNQNTAIDRGFNFSVIGKKVGLTQAEFFIYHEGHSDMRTGKVPVLILPANK